MFSLMTGYKNVRTTGERLNMDVGEQGIEGFSFLAQNPRKGRRLDCPWIMETKWGLKGHKQGKEISSEYRRLLGPCIFVL